MERRIALKGATNFRDLGGYQTADGRRVQWRRAFRADTLARLTDDDVAAVAGLGISTACDLRYAEERAAEPSRLLGHARIEVLALGLDRRPGASFLDSYAFADDPAEAAYDYLVENYAKYPFLYAQAYRAIFARLAAGERVVLHCTAGKDRAGTAAAMLLTALGVPRETVFDDYLLTNAYWDHSGRARPGMSAEAVAAIFTARREYLESAFHAVEARFGSVEAYLADHLDLDAEALETLRAACLE
jgi:protein-tyrosine phosphatase